MLITKRNLDIFLKAFSASRKNKLHFWGLDFETTGIQWHKNPHVPWYEPRIFSIQFAAETGEDYYLDFQHSEDKLGDAAFARLASEVFADPSCYWFDHNGKFELHHARNHGIEIVGTVHCTKHIARVVNNLEESLKLDDLAEKYFKTPKIDVKTTIQEQKLYTEVHRFGWKPGDDAEKWLHFDRLPLELLIKYGELDTRLCFNLGKYQLEQIQLADDTYYKGSSAKLSNVLHNENKLTKTAFEMERVGIQLDMPYCKAAFAHESAEYTRFKSELNEALTPGILLKIKEKQLDRPYCKAAFAHESAEYTRFKSELNEALTPGILLKIKENHEENAVNWLSPHHIKTVFESLGEKSVKLTSKGKMSFDKEALEAMQSPLAAQVLKYRYHYKRAHTYFQNFIWLADSSGVLHCDLQNSGAETGRQSCWNPNLQNVPKRRDKDEEKFKVRKCFVPRAPFFFADKDYSGAEFYMAMDYAKELKVIDQIKLGLDPHEFTREEFKSYGFDLKDRDTAKTMTFRLIYGAGGETVGKALGFKPGWEAKKRGKEAKDAYFKMFPRFGAFMVNAQNAAKQRGYVFNWLGRLLRYVNTGGFGVETWFKSPNGIIQGGIGDTLKVAMNEIAELLRGKKTRMIIPIHDAILFEMHPDEKELSPLIDAIMKKVYPAKLLPLEVDSGYSSQDWASLVDEMP